MVALPPVSALALLVAAWEAQPAATAAAAAVAAAPPARSDGGAFGQWIDSDSGGMPAFDYTLDQTSSAGAKLARAYYDAERQTDWRDPTDNLFELGNDRLVGKQAEASTHIQPPVAETCLKSSLTEIACTSCRLDVRLRAGAPGRNGAKVPAGRRLQQPSVRRRHCVRRRQHNARATGDQLVHRPARVAPQIRHRLHVGGAERQQY